MVMRRDTLLHRNPPSPPVRVCDISARKAHTHIHFYITFNKEYESWKKMKNPVELIYGKI